MATRNTDVERARQAGARRRALLEGRPLPPEPAAPPSAAADHDAEHASARAASTSNAPDAHADATGAPGAGTDGWPPANPNVPGPTTAAAATTDMSPGADTADTPAPTPAARGPWFDARAFFLGWLAMAIAFFAGASGFLVAMVGFAAGYFFARRSRIVNALVAVAGGTAATFALMVLLALALAAFSG